MQVRPQCGVGVPHHCEPQMATACLAQQPRHHPSLIIRVLAASVRVRVVQQLARRRAAGEVPVVAVVCVAEVEEVVAHLAVDKVQQITPDTRTAPGGGGEVGASWQRKKCIGKWSHVRLRRGTGCSAVPRRTCT